MVCLSEARASQSINEMPTNSLFDTLNPSGSMGVGERYATKQKALKNTRSHSANVTTKKPFSSSPSRSQKAQLKNSPTFQRKETSPSQSPGNTSRPSGQRDNQNPLIGIALLCSICGLVGVGFGFGGFNSSKTNHSVASNSPSYSQDTSGYGSIPYGKARFKSGRTGKAEIIGVSLSQRKNINDHIVYDASWADGYTSKYVFWSNGKVEIFSKNGAGKLERTNAWFRNASNGDCVITADTKAVTTFPRFSPVVN